MALAPKHPLRQLGQRIKRFRKIKKLTQEQLATAIGLTTSAVGRMEIGKAYPSLEAFAALCEVLEISADELIFNKSDESQQLEAAKASSPDEFLKKYVESLERENNLLRSQLDK